MVCASVRSIIPELKFGDYLSVQAHKPCSISHLFTKSNNFLGFLFASLADIALLNWVLLLKEIGISMKY